MKNILFHVPHDGHSIPEELKPFLTVDEETFKYYDKQMSDIHMTTFAYKLGYPVTQYGISRLICDVERFIDNEPMEKYGMGFCYEKFFDGKKFKDVNEITKTITKRYYDEYHKYLNYVVIDNARKGMLLIDLHSFNVKATRKELINPNIPLPDVCIGVEKGFYNLKTLNKAVTIFKKHGYSVAVNYPYKGSMVPNIVYSGELSFDFESIMFEINSECYLDENRELSEKSEKLQEAIKDFCLSLGK